MAVSPSTRPLCAWCQASGQVTLSTDRVPHLLAHVCQAHAEEFWQRVVRTGAALSELRTLMERPSALPPRVARRRASSPAFEAFPTDESADMDPSTCPAGERPEVHLALTGCPSCGYLSDSRQSV